MTDVFKECRERVPAIDAGRQYGLIFDRRGWALCPFHQDKHASMSFKNGRFHCWVCDLQGDSIDLTARLFSLEPLAAVRRLNEDFRLALPLDKPPTPEERQAARRRQEVDEAYQVFEEWRNGFLNRLTAAYREGHQTLQNCQGLDRLTEREALAIRCMGTVEQLANALESGTAQEQMEIFREREVIEPRIRAILMDLPMRSGKS